MLTMTKTALAVAFAALLIIAAAGTILVDLALANPYSHIMFVNGGDVYPRSDTKPPKILILSPENNSTFTANGAFISFNVEVGESKSADQTSLMIESVYYKADWLENYTYVYKYIADPSVYTSQTKSEFSTTLNITDIPEGRHSMIVYAVEKGTYYEPSISEVPMWSLNTTVTYYSFKVTGASPVSFTIDATPLSVSVLPIKNETYAKSEVSGVPLNFILNEEPSKISYVLDGHDNVTIAGNTTLTGLLVGVHNVTVFVWDAAGNVVSSETANFIIVSEPFLTLIVASVSVTLVAVVVAAGLLVYHRRKSPKQFSQETLTRNLLSPTIACEVRWV